MTNKKLGFGGQWLKTFTVGEHVGVLKDGKKKKIQVTPDFINNLANNYDVSLHEAPATIGHPEHDAPAYGWIADARVNSDGDALEIQFADTQPEFEEMVNKGLFKKRSLKLYMGADAPGGKAPYIRHCAFLGAMPPAIKGLPDVQFKEDEGETITFDIEFSEGEPVVTEPKKNEKSISEQIADFFREKFGAKEDKAATVQFSEADAQTLIEKAVKPLTEKITSLEDENKKLRESVEAQAGSSKRGEIVAFCESMPGTVLPWMKKAGAIEFMEAIAPIEDTVDVISFAEDGKEEKTFEFSPLDWFKNFLTALNKSPQIQFGESFGDVKLKGDGSDLINPGQEERMLKTMGMTKEAAGKK